MEKQIATNAITKQIIQKHNFTVKKNYGQNFLIDNHVLNKIITSSHITAEDCVLEIGPGLGGLTEILCDHAKKVIAVEIDKTLIPILQENLANKENVTIINDDILKVDIEKLIEEENDGKPIKVVANLPYYITTPIIMGLLEKKLKVKSITVMVQKEVAYRMKSEPSTKDYGALTLAVQYYANTYLVANVPPNCFVPRPNVDSAVIRLDVHETRPVTPKDENYMFEIIKAAFSQRRKTLLNCLFNWENFNFTKEEIKVFLEKASLHENVRGETLSLVQFCVLSDVMKS